MRRSNATKAGDRIRNQWNVTPRASCTMFCFTPGTTNPPRLGPAVGFAANQHPLVECAAHLQVSTDAAGAVDAGAPVAGPAERAPPEAEADSEALPRLRMLRRCRRNGDASQHREGDQRQSCRTHRKSSRVENGLKLGAASQDATVLPLPGGRTPPGLRAVWDESDE